MNKSDNFLLKVTAIAGGICAFTGSILGVVSLLLVAGVLSLQSFATRVFFIILGVISFLSLAVMTTCEWAKMESQRHSEKELAMAMKKRHREQTKAKIFGKR